MLFLNFADMYREKAILLAIHKYSHLQVNQPPILHNLAPHAAIAETEEETKVHVCGRVLRPIERMKEKTS